MSCPHTQEQNGVAERKHHHIVENGLALLAKSSIPLKYWDEAFRTAVFLHNRLPTPILKQKCSLEFLFKTKPNYSFLKVFGSACYPNTHPFNKHKLQFRSTVCTFMGYSLNHKGYKCLDSNGKLYISRDVIFDETTFPFAQTNQYSYSIHNSSSLSNSTPSASPPILTVPSQTHSHPVSHSCPVVISIDKPINEVDLPSVPNVHSISPVTGVVV